MSHMNDDDPLLNNDASQAKRPWRLSEVGIVKRCPCLPRCCCVLLGLILLALSVQIFFLPGLIKQIVRDTLEDSLIFKYPSNSSSYKAWISNTGSDGVPIWMEMRFFNVTNKDDVIQKGDFPLINLTEPLVYNEFQIKEHVNFSDNGEWVEYNLWTYYTFNKERSKLQRNDTVIVFSPLLAAVLHAYEKGDDVDRLLFKLVLRDINNNPELLFLEKTAEEVLFEFLNYHKNYTVLGRTIPVNIETGGLLNNKSTPSQVEHTGYGDHSRQSEVKKYEGKEWVDCWKVALQLSPGHDNYFGLYTIKKGYGNTLLAWVNDLFVNLIIEYNGTTNYNGIELYRYTVQIIPQFLNYTQYPPNDIYFAEGPSGVLNLTNCYSGIPFFVSLPMFLGGPDYEKNLTLMGLEPVSWDEQPFIDIEPVTGVIFNANKSLQMNTHIQPIPEEYLMDDDADDENVESDNIRRILNDFATVEIIDGDNKHQAGLRANGSSSNSTNTTSTPTTSANTTTTSAATNTTTTSAPIKNTTAAPTESPTTSPTMSPTASPTDAPTYTLANIPNMYVPIIETSECEGLTASQVHTINNAIEGANTMEKAFTIVGYVAIPLLVIYTWAVCFWCGKRRAGVQQEV